MIVIKKLAKRLLWVLRSIHSMIKVGVNGFVPGSFWIPRMWGPMNFSLESELLHNNKDLETEKKWQEWVFQKNSFLFRICKKGPKWSAIRLQLECKTSWSSISSEVYINFFNFLPRDIHPGKVASEAMFFGWVWASMPSHAQICPDLPWVPSGCVRGVLGKR